MSYSAFFNDESQIADRCIWRARNNKSQCSIGIITKINASPVSVDVQPLVNYFDQNGGFTKYPILQKLPIVQFQSTFYSINTPVNIGDTGLLLWFDREVYTTLVNGASTPQNPSSGDLSNQNAAIFLPIVQSFAKANPLKPTGVDVQSLGPSVLTGSPMISLLGELIALVMQLGTFMTDMNSFLAQIVTAAGPYGSPTTPMVGLYAQQLATASTTLEGQITTINAKFAQIQADLTTFKGGQP